MKALVTLLKEQTPSEPEKKELALQILELIGYPTEAHWKYDSNLNYKEIEAILKYIKELQRDNQNLSSDLFFRGE